MCHVSVPLLSCRMGQMLMLCRRLLLFARQCALWTFTTSRFCGQATVLPLRWSSSHVLSKSRLGKRCFSVRASAKAWVRLLHASLR